MKQTILWICNGKNPNCSKTHCALLHPDGDCTHTANEQCARAGDHYFEQAQPGVLWEVEHEQG
jgi:hypothetical protein